MTVRGILWVLVLGCVVLGGAFIVRAQRGGAKVNPMIAMPPMAIPTFSTENVARTAFFYAGGEYVGEKGKEVMDGAMYTEVWVPKNLRHPYPIVFYHGAGQTGTDWLQTPDGRPG